MIKDKIDIEMSRSQRFGMKLNEKNGWEKPIFRSSSGAYMSV